MDKVHTNKKNSIKAEIDKDEFSKSDYSNIFKSKSNYLKIFKETNIKDVVKRITDEIKDPKETELGNLIIEFLKDEGFKDKDLVEILAFLNNNKFNLKKYNTLALKTSKKREKSVYAEKAFTAGLATWLVQNESKYNSPFYQNLKKLLFDFYPTDTTEEYISVTMHEMDLANHSKVRELAVKKHNIPMKAFLTYLVSNYTSSYEAMLKGYCVTSYDEFLVILKKEISKNFEILTEIMDVITPKAQLKLLDLLIKKEEEKTIRYILTELVEKATAKQVAQKIIYILKDKTELKDDIIKLLSSKKKPAREIAVELLISWNLPENKKLLKPLLKDKSQKIVSMIADFLATV